MAGMSDDPAPPESLLPYDVWAVRDDTTSVETLWQAVHDLGIPAIQIIDTQTLWLQEVNRPARQGLFSMVSLSFVVAFGLALLALVVSMYADMQRRVIEMGILMALGMSKTQTQLLLVAEHASMMIIGVSTGIILIIFNTRTLLPYIHGGISPHFNVPTTQPVIAYGSIVMIIVAFVAAFAGLLLLVLARANRHTLVEQITLNQTYD